MKRQVFTALGAAAAIASLASQAQAAPACALVAPQTVAFEYDPFDPALLTQGSEFRATPLQITRTAGSADEAAFVEVQFVDQNAGRPEVADGLGYEIVVDGRTVSVGAAGAVFGAQESVVLPFGPDGRIQTTALVRLIGSGGALDLRAGRYASAIAARVRCGSSPGAETGFVEQSGALAIEARVPNKLSASISGLDAGRMDFGAMTTGVARSAVINVRSTGQFALTVRSDNGAMTWNGEPASSLPESLRVAYAVSIADAPVIMDTPRLMPPAGVGGTALSFSVRVTDDVMQKRAGQYRDRLEVVFTPQ